MVSRFSTAVEGLRITQAGTDWGISVAGRIAHGLVSIVGIALSGYRLADLRCRGRVVVFLQTSRIGQLIGRIIRWALLPLFILTAWMEFQPVDHRAELLRAINAALFGLIALIGPLAVAALSYRRWIAILLAIAGVAEVLQLSPNVPGIADAADFLTTGIVMLMTTSLGLYLKWFGRQDFEDTALWARPWIDISRKHIGTPLHSDTVPS